jgi:hypothetical protein
MAHDPAPEKYRLITVSMLADYANGRACRIGKRRLTAREVAAGAGPH